MSWRRHAIAEPMFRTRPCVADIAMTISTCGKSARSSPRRMGTSMGMAANAREDHSSGPPIPVGPQEHPATRRRQRVEIARAGDAAKPT